MSEPAEFQGQSRSELIRMLERSWMLQKQAESQCARAQQEREEWEARYECSHRTNMAAQRECDAAKDAVLEWRTRATTVEGELDLFKRSMEAITPVRSPGSPFDVLRGQLEQAEARAEKLAAAAREIERRITERIDTDCRRGNDHGVCPEDSREHAGVWGGVEALGWVRRELIQKATRLAAFAADEGEVHARPIAPHEGAVHSVLKGPPLWGDSEEEKDDIQILSVRPVERAKGRDDVD